MESSGFSLLKTLPLQVDAAAQCVKPHLGMEFFGQVLALPPELKRGGSSNTWVSESQVEDPGGVPDFWIQPGTALAGAGI